MTRRNSSQEATANIWPIRRATTFVADAVYAFAYALVNQDHKTFQSFVQT